MNAAGKLKKARTQLVLDQPFFGSLALRLELRQDQTVDTAYTDGVVLGFNPSFIERLNLQETKWLVAHEVMHLACLHHTRRADREPSRWNVAADHAINVLLAEAGFKTPSGCLLDYCYGGKSAEAIYGMLPENLPDPGPGEVRDSPGGETEKKQVEARWRVTVAQAAQQAKSMGEMPDGIKRLVEAVLYPKVDWRQVLRHFVEQAARNDYCWLPPSRRYLSQGFCLPSLHSKELGRIVIAVDTSASVDTAALSQFGAEISAVLEAFDTLLDIVYCDTAIQGHEQCTRLDLPLALSAAGFGGTDYRPVFAFVDEQEIAPRCLLYLTDLECHRFPHHAPDYPVLWVQTGQYPGSVPFGEIVQMK